MRKKLLIALLLIASATLYMALTMGLSATHLRTDLLENTDYVGRGGYPVAKSLEEAVVHADSFELALIYNRHPSLSWQLESSRQETKQQAYRILVASRKDLLAEEKADVWDSGKVLSEQSVSVGMEGQELSPSTLYYWTVKVWDNKGRSSRYAEGKPFYTAPVLDGTVARYPLVKTDEAARDTVQWGDSVVVADFGKAAFGQLRLKVSVDEDDTLTIHLGEAMKDGRVDRKPGASIRYAQYSLPVRQGTHTYDLTIRPDARNTSKTANVSGVCAILMPKAVGEVYPFRYCEIERGRKPYKVSDIVRPTVTYPFNGQESAFACNDTVLNDVWDLSKYSIKATSFCGVYVDGDRERIPYEADAYINQLCHYGVDSEYSMARYTADYLMEWPTWPTEWHLQSVLMMWSDYMYTGDDTMLRKHYELLKAKTFLALKQENGLISTSRQPLDETFMQSVRFKGKEIKDIVDWPRSGAFGIDKKEAGEADGYVLTDYNTVVNAFHYRTLVLMEKIADVLGKDKEAAYYKREAERVKHTMRELLFDKQQGVYRDGLETEHMSLHANMFPLAFGMVDESDRPRIMEFIHSRGMACSVYGSQFLMDALYEARDADYALSLLTSTSSRSWYNMIRVGSTVTLEAWDPVYKNNLDWNHAWGAAPANIIPRKVMGVEPLDAGFGRVRIMPQPGTLKHAAAVIPTIRGRIQVSFSEEEDGSYRYRIVIPANMEAEICLPGDNEAVTVGSGCHKFRTGRP